MAGCRTWRPCPEPAIPGLEAAGVVDEVGPGRHRCRGGRRGDGPDRHRFLRRVRPGRRFALKPAGLSWEAAAALLVALETADRVLDVLGLTAGETLLVHGAAGAVGAFGVQLAVARGVTVVGTASPRNHDYLRSLGAIPVTYGDGLADRVRALAPQGIDAVFDAAGQSALEVRSSCAAASSGS